MGACARCCRSQLISAMKGSVSQRLPLVLGGLGLRSAERTKFASWAACFPTEFSPSYAVGLAVGRFANTQCLSEVAAIPFSLSGVGLEVPTWLVLMLGARAPPREPDDHEPGPSWQHEAASWAQCRRVRRGPSSYLKQDPWMGWHCPPLRASSLIFSALFCCSVFVNLFLCLRAAAVWPLSRRPWPPLNSLCKGVQRGFAVENVVARICQGGKRLSAHDQRP